MRLIDLPQLLTDLKIAAHLHELRALSATGPTRWDERRCWLASAEELRRVAARLSARQEVTP